jgi:acetyl esterase
MSGITIVDSVPARLAGTQRGPVLEPAVRRFLSRTTTLPRLSELDPIGVREVLDAVQVPGDLALPPVEIDNLTVPVAGPLGSVSFRIVRPEGARGALPVILYIHGGGWIAGGVTTHQRLMTELAVGTGAAVVFPLYSRVPEARYPWAIRESYAALTWVARHGASQQLDGSRIAIAGDSVGATIATTLTLLAKERGGPALAAQVLFYPATDADFKTDSYRQFATGYWLRRDTMQWFWEQYVADDALRAEVTASPLRAALSELARLPPALIITAEADVLRDEGEAYARKLADAGVDVTTSRYQGVVHDFVVLNQLRPTAGAEAAISAAVTYLAAALMPCTSRPSYRIGW